MRDSTKKGETALKTSSANLTIPQPLGPGPQQPSGPSHSLREPPECLGSDGKPCHSQIQF